MHLDNIGPDQRAGSARADLVGDSEGTIFHTKDPRGHHTSSDKARAIVSNVNSKQPVEGDFERDIVKIGPGQYAVSHNARVLFIETNSDGIESVIAAKSGPLVLTEMVPNPV